MISPRLPSVAVIPDSLYVERAADRQLAAVIHEMGRPGYVLDPRQMGKTNLLLHARRRLGSECVRFVYADLSVRSRSAPAFYRRLLEIAATSHADLFGTEAIAESMAALSEDAVADPATIFQNALTGVLEGWSGRLVMILDEVDGLTGRSFSDGVFAHIRSLYFARETVPSLGKLTFVLAGVAEPSQLITDKSISPFNIGQKIFLRDFTPDQVEELLRRSALPFGGEAVARMIHWTNGNPRLTWDLAAELDVLELGGGAVTPESVDEAVERLFLTSFDRPPIDHVRTLVEHDVGLRMGVIAMRRGEQLSDRQRSALHLAGIATQVPGDRQPAFRNLVIDRAISDRWLKELEFASREQLVIAQVAFRDRRFEDSVRGYDRYLTGRTWSAADRQDILRLGIAQFELGDFVAALSSFELFGTLGSARPEPALLIWTARTKAAQSLFSDAEADYRAALGASPNRHERVRILVGLARIVIAEPPRRAEARALAEAAIDAIGGARVGEGGASLKRYEAYALELLASLSQGSDRRALLNRAVELQGDAPSLTTMSMLVAEGGDGAARNLEILVRTFVGSLPSKRLMIELGAAAAAIRSAAGGDGFRAAIRDLAQRSGADRSAVYGLIFDGLVAAGDRAPLGDVGQDILEEALARTVSPALGLHVGRTVLLGQGTPPWNVASRYLEMVSRRDETLTRNDYLTLLSIAAETEGGDRTELNERLLAAAAGLAKPSDPRLRQSFLLVRYVQVVAAMRSGDNDMAQRLATDGLLLVEEIRAAPEQDLPSPLMAQITDFLTRASLVQAKQTPVRNAHRHLGRNDLVTVRYRDGTTVNGKFKLLSGDLDTGACELVESGGTGGR